MHTPAPWTIRANDLMQTIHADGAPIALPCMNDRVSALQCSANARVIAAAPELLAALDELLRVTVDDMLADGYELNDAQFSARKRALEAIARATGADHA